MRLPVCHCLECRGLQVWNLTEQEASFSIPVPEQVMHIKWNYTGSLLAVTCKDMLQYGAYRTLLQVYLLAHASARQVP